MAVRLNLGAGQNLLPQSEGWINIDRFGEAEVKCDLEVTPWRAKETAFVIKSMVRVGNEAWDRSDAGGIPLWEDSTVDEILLNHVLEHLGRDPDTFIAIMKEMYRICKPGAKVHIAVPHPRHDNFLNDPTHVRIITPELLLLFSKRQCELVKKMGGANSSLALYHDINFEIENAVAVLDDRWAHIKDRPDEQMRLGKMYNNVFSEYRIVLRAVK